jgi:hypothetical protein
MVSFADQLNKPIEAIATGIKIDDTTSLEVRAYLPTKEKEELLNFIVTSAIDEETACFSPLRVNAYFTIAICKWYASIEITDKDLEDAGHVYDTLETSGIAEMVKNAIPDGEYNFIESLVEDTVADISRYYTSAAGLIELMSRNAAGLGIKIDDILNKTTSEKGQKSVEFLKDVVEKG